MELKLKGVKGNDGKKGQTSVFTEIEYNNIVLGEKFFYL